MENVETPDSCMVCLASATERKPQNSESRGYFPHTQYLSGFWGIFWELMKEICCLSPDIHCTTILYEEDAVLHTGSFQEAFQNKRNPKDSREFLPRGQIDSYGKRGRKKRGKISLYCRVKVPDVFNGCSFPINLITPLQDQRNWWKMHRRFSSKGGLSSPYSTFSTPRGGQDARGESHK